MQDISEWKETKLIKGYFKILQETFIENEIKFLNYNDIKNQVTRKRIILQLKGFRIRLFYTDNEDSQYHGVYFLGHLVLVFDCIWDLKIKEIITSTIINLYLIIYEKESCFYKI